MRVSVERDASEAVLAGAAEVAVGEVARFDPAGAAESAVVGAGRGNAFVLEFAFGGAVQVHAIA